MSALGSRLMLPILFNTAASLSCLGDCGRKLAKQRLSTWLIMAACFFLPGLLLNVRMVERTVPLLSLNTIDILSVASIGVPGIHN